MNITNNSTATLQQIRRNIAVALILFFVGGFLFVPSAEAQIACGGGPFATTEPIDLLSCNEYKPGNGASADITIPTGIQVGDVLIAIVQIDDAGTSAVFTDNSGYWTSLSGDPNTNGIYSEIFYDRVDPGDLVLDGTTTNFSWTGGNERFYGIVLHLRGAKDTFDLGVATNDGNSATPPAPAITTIVDNTFILRTLSLDRNRMNVDDSGLPGHTDIALDNTGNGNGGVAGGAAYLYQATPAVVPAANWVLTTNDGYHTRSIGIRPAEEIRFSMPDATAPECGIQLVTIDISDANGNVLDYYTGTINISASNSTGGYWAEPGGGVPGILTNGVNGSATFQFVGADNGSVTLEFFNPVGGSAVAFDGNDIADSFIVQSTSAGYTSPVLNITDCEFRIALAGDGFDAMGTCSAEAVTVTLVDSLTLAPATHYTGTMTITAVANNGGGAVTAGNYTYVSGATPGNFLDGTAGDGQATYTFLQGESSVTMSYTDLVQSGSTIDFDISGNTVSNITEVEGGANDPDLTVSSCEFRISIPDLSSDTCSQNEVTIAVFDASGSPVDDYVGLVTISNDANLGIWSVSTATNGLNDLGAGAIEYLFDGSDNGSIVLNYYLSTVNATVNFQVVENVPSGVDSPVNPYDPDLEIFACSIGIVIAPTMGVCTAGELLTISILDRDSNPAVDFEGSILVETDSINGNYALNGGDGGNGIFDNLPVDDGETTYTFDPLAGDAGVLGLDFSSVVIENIEFSVSSNDFDYTVPVVTTDNLQLLGCEVEITVDDAGNEGDVCTVNSISFSIVDTAGGPVTGFSGDLTFSTANFSGNWSGGETNSVVDLTADDGEASYEFDPLDDGDVSVDLSYDIPDAAVGFTASAIADNGAAVTLSATTNETIDIQNCKVDIQVTDGDVLICSAGEEVSYQIQDRNGNDITDYLGTITLLNENLALVGVGDYSVVDNGQDPDLRFSNFGNGSATFSFLAADNGLLTVEFTHDVEDTVNLNIAGAGLEEDTVSSVDDVVFNSCKFQISVSDTTTDVCSVIQVTIGVVDNNDLPVPSYLGTINLSTLASGLSGGGLWSNLAGSALGTLTEDTIADGQASYEFEQGGLDGSDIVLDFIPTLSATALNFNVTDLTTSDLGNVDDPVDPDINVEVCTFQISYDGFATTNTAESSACEIDQVSIRVFDRDSAQASNYTGTVNIEIDSNVGTWIDTDASNFGTLIDSGLNDGTATYQFDPVAGDDGEVILDLLHLDSGSLDIDLEDGEIVEDGAADPLLSKTSCLPDIHASVCYTNVGSDNNAGTIELPAWDAAVEGRLALMLLASRNGSGVDSVEFAHPDLGAVPLANPQDMDFIFAADSVQVPNNRTEIWGLLENKMPENAADSDATITVNFSGNTTSTMCLLTVNDAAQSYPATSGTDGDPVNGGEIDTGLNPGEAITTITTTANNSFVVSLVSDSDNNGETYDDVDPNPPITRLEDENIGTQGNMAVSTGRSSSAAALTVTETSSSGGLNSQTHILASFEPLVSGAPTAEGYVPVTLFKTYSGNISYKAVGNTLRNAPNNTYCTFFAEGSGGGSIAPLTLPDDPNSPGNAGSFNSVTAAWLYWAGSGDIDDEFSGEIQPNVLFGVDGAQANITADDVFIITNATTSFPGLDYYLGYKDVTAEVGAAWSAGGNAGNVDFRFSFLAGDSPVVSTPGGDSGCLGGWALVVVYDNIYEELRVLNLFHGFQPFRYSEFTLVPRNFRMAPLDNTRNLPNGQITHISFEGDESGNVSDEGLEIQDAPGGTTFTEIYTSLNPQFREFNSTVTRPVYCYDSIIGTFQWVNAIQPAPNCLADVDPTAVRDGYELDFPGSATVDPFSGSLNYPDPYTINFVYDDFSTDPGVGGTNRIGGSPGVDIDTHYLQDELDAFVGTPGEEAEEITTKYLSEADLVMLAAEVISVTNYPIADIEITKTALSAFTVGDVGQYSIEVTNNGSGTSAGGYADGQIIISDILPDGMALNAATPFDGIADGWDCGTNGGSEIGVFEVGPPGKFTCVFDIATTNFTGALDVVENSNYPDLALPGGNGQDGHYELAKDVSLPLLTINVDLDPAGANFSQLENLRTNVARVLHVGFLDPNLPPQTGLESTSCDTPLVAGVSPQPDDSNSLTTDDCSRAPQFDNVNDLQGGTIDLNDLDEKTGNNNNVSEVEVDVRGAEAELEIDKFISSVLEEGGGAGEGQYTIRVTNNGPDATTAGFVVSDTQPVGVTFYSVSDNNTVLTTQDSDWDCAAPISPNVSCTYVGAGLANGASKNLILNVTVTGSSGQNVTNTASVAPGQYNFDENPLNDSDTDVTAISAVPVGSSEKFLLSVNDSVAGGPTTIGGLAGIEDGDLILYDPVLDVATAFLDSTDLGGSTPLTDINAVHLLPNGQVVLSVGVASNYDNGSGDVAFLPGDLVVFDPISNTTSLLFQGSSVFGAAEDIDAVYLLDDGCTILAWPNNQCQIVFSVVDDNGLGDASDVASIGDDDYGPDDMILYDPTEADINLASSIFLQGSSATVFNSDGISDIDAFYVRVDESAPEGVVDIFALSVDNDATTIIGVAGTYEPAGGTGFTRDDVVQLDEEIIQTAEDGSELLFRGNVPLGVFTTSNATRRLDALHVLEDGYMGHFSISQSQAGTTCEAGKITISKHLGLGHAIDTNYFGGILLSTDSGSPNNEGWSLDTGNGSLTNLGNGSAIYTFVPSDNGQVTLNLFTPDVTSNLNVSVSNGIVSELGSEDPNFDFNNVITTVSYRDEFTTASFSNNDGSAGWAGPWLEGSDDADPDTGSVQIAGGLLQLTASPGTPGGAAGPSIKRYAIMDENNGGFVRGTQDVYLEFDYSYSGVNLGADTITVEISDDDATYYEVVTYDAISGTNGSPISENFLLKDGNLAGSYPAVDFDDGDLYVRFRVSGGYTGSAQFNVDNVDLNSGTTSCNVGLLSHYDITITNPNGISCLASTITIVGHNAQHGATPPLSGEVMTLTSYFNNGGITNRGTWSSLVSGAGNFTNNIVNGSSGNGVASYEWNGTDETAQFLFNYTELSQIPETVYFNVFDSSMVGEDLTEDDTLSVSDAVLRFFNESDQTPGIPTQISGKSSHVNFDAHTLILQALQTTPEDASVCQALFPDTEVVNIEFSAECANPDSCSITAPAQGFTVNETPIALVDTDGVPGAISYTTVPVTFTDQTTSTGAEVRLNYSDAGQIELNARYEIPLANDEDNALRSGDYLEGSESYVVRPFGFDIDFMVGGNPDRVTNGVLGASYADPLNIAAASTFVATGEVFSTFVTAKAWQDIDDQAPQDGAPDYGANLIDNLTTPAFGREDDGSTSVENDVEITHALVEPAAAIGTREGTINNSSNGLISAYTAGVGTPDDLVFDEVGIIDLFAQLAEDGGSERFYLSGGQNIQGSMRNVGRFYPDHFLLTPAGAAAVCSATANEFTYMGQEFTVMFSLEARNHLGNTTQNYIGDFVRMVGSAFDDDGVFHAVDDVVGFADVPYSARLTSVNGSFSATFGSFGSNPGIGDVEGELIFVRQTDGALGATDGGEDGPYTVRLGTDVEDGDNVAITLTLATDIDVDDGSNEDTAAIYREFSNSDVEFRYGRLVVENAFGPEGEDLEIPVRIEYWDSAATPPQFVINVDDGCTVLSSVAAPLASAFSVVAGSTFAPDFAVDALEEVDVSVGQGIGGTNITLYEGQTERQEDGNTDATDDSDRPFLAYLAQPNEEIGGVLIEFDLNALGLDFLRYDWRDGENEEDIFDEVPEHLDTITPTDDVYTDNPRALIEFGSYRGHDRVINWQEIYLAPGP